TCGGEDFAVACMRANLRYGTNQRREDVKSHHYIISFDPRDGPDNGLTVDRAQALGEQFCKEHFPGHQALVCTHPDGHNHSGNIHVHIVINSLRIEEVPFLPYMDRPADTKAGCKHRCTDAALRYFKSEVMEMCHREGLYQIDLLNGSKNRVTDREYWAQKKGQAALDKQNAPMIAGGITPRQTKFETNKEKLRQTIRAALSAATSFEDFSSLLLREGVAVKESRGRLSYLTPDRTKPITARKLGDDFDRAAVLAVLEQNAARATEKAAAIPEYPRHGKTGIQPTKAPQTAPKQDGVQRLVDIEQKKAEGKGRGYERWATMHNLKQMAATLNVYQEYGFTSPEQLEAAVDTAYQEMRQTSGELKALETKLQGKKELQRQVLAYAKTKPARDGLKAQKSEKARAAYRQANESDFIIAEAAARYFKAHGITKLPARKALQAEIEQLVSKKSGLYNTYHEQKQRYVELQTVKRNIDQILRREEPRRRKEQSHER
ncbi:relaxase/mobilization nuclease domain-containing protein, partial [Dysosmobacter sp.]|uniref:relaxase/mobilization nuclease domain-containing protein n=1 Tax=Dysosmobacter sp. TaxID=2591382 RepID=UPI003AB40F3E